MIELERSAIRDLTYLPLPDGKLTQIMAGENSMAGTEQSERSRRCCIEAVNR